MRRAVTLLLFASVLVGCQSSDTGFYDKEARDEAMRAARKDPFDGQSKVVSVGSVNERDECPQAPSSEAGRPCLNVTVTSEFPARDMSGKEVGLNVQTQMDFFVWLEKRGDGRWKVTHSSYRPKGVCGQWAAVHTRPVTSPRRYGRSERSQRRTRRKSWQPRPSSPAGQVRAGGFVWVGSLGRKPRTLWRKDVPAVTAAAITANENAFP